MDDFKILLQAIIDNSSLSNAQKQIAKEKFVANLDVSVDINKFASEKKKISEDFSKLANEIDQAFKNIGIELNTKQLNSFTNEYINGIKQATKEQEKLNNSQKKHDLKIQEKYYKRIIDNNKSIYSLKKNCLKPTKSRQKKSSIK